MLNPKSTQSFVANTQFGLNPNQPHDAKGRFGETSGGKEDGSKSLAKEQVATEDSRFSDNERESIGVYGDYGYESINQRLRMGVADEHAKNIKQAFKKAPELSADTEVYRGLQTTEEGLGRFKEGVVISDKGFISTSYSKAVGTDYAKYAYKGSNKDQSVRFDITVRKGTRYLKLSNSGGGKGTASEAELLFRNGSRMRISSVKTVTGMTIVKADLL